MYSIVEIEKNIDSYFGNHIDVAIMLKKQINDMLSQSWQQISHDLLEIRNIYINTQSLPEWFRKLVYLVVYNELSMNRGNLNQTDILKQLNLSPDIFTKHWNMYSPEFELKQKRFIEIDFNFGKDEIESNRANVALIHYIVSNATIQTDTFIDIFGKNGIIPAVCARGYKNRICLITDERIAIFNEGLLQPVKVYNFIKSYQKEIDNRQSYKDKYKYIIEHRDIYYYSLNKDDKNKASAEYYLCSYFHSKYWENSIQDKVVYKDEISGRNEVFKEIREEQVPINKIKDFLNLKKDDFKFLNALYKGIQFKNVDFTELLKNMAASYYSSKNCFLYIDIPKITIEEDRYSFSYGKYLNMINLLGSHIGNFILSWKTVYEISDLDRIKQVERVLLYIKKLQEELGKKLYVYKYRQMNRNSADSIVFISDVFVEDFDNYEIKSKYNIADGSFIIEDFDTFYNMNKPKWLEE